MKRFLLFADAHLDTPFASVPPDAARRRRQAIRDAVARIVQLAADQRVDALLCAGDLYEHDRVSADTGQFLRTQFERLAPMPVLLAPGNHDWLGPESLYRRIDWPANVHLFDSSHLTRYLLGDGFSVWGAAHLAPAGTSSFLQGFRTDGGGVHLALMHASESSFLPEEEQGKQPHAPFRAEEVARAGLHFAFVGHYHKPRDGSRLVYPGNPEPLTFGESGERGAVIGTVHDDGRVDIERHRVAVSSVHDLDLDVTGCDTSQEVRDRLTSRLRGIPGYARIILKGELAPAVDLQVADLESVVTDLDAPPVMRLGDVTVAYDLAAVAREQTVRGQFVREVQADASLTDNERRRVIITGLRALDGREDLEVF